jgi:hypothetical protein
MPPASWILRHVLAVSVPAGRVWRSPTCCRRSPAAAPARASSWRPRRRPAQDEISEAGRARLAQSREIVTRVGHSYPSGAIVSASGSSDVPISRRKRDDPAEGARGEAVRLATELLAAKFVGSGPGAPWSTAADTWPRSERPESAPGHVPVESDAHAQIIHGGDTPAHRDVVHQCPLPTGPLWRGAPNRHGAASARRRGRAVGRAAGSGGAGPGGAGGFSCTSDPGRGAGRDWAADEPAAAEGAGS